MRIEKIEDSSLKYNCKNYDKLKNGLVIFPDNLKDVKNIKNLKKFLKSIQF